MENEISLRELFQIIKKRAGLIVMITVLFAGLSGVFTYFFVTPVYQASTQLLVNQVKDEQMPYAPNSVQTNLQLINTYSVIMKSSAILEKVADQLGNNLTASQLNQKITVSSAEESQVVNLIVQDSNPKRAADIANTTAEVFQKEIINIMNIDNISILAKANASDYQAPIKPQPMMNIAIGLVIGLMAGVGLVFLLEYLDNTVKTEKDVETLLELPVIGSVAVMKATKKDNHEDNVKQYSDARGEKIGS